MGVITNEIELIGFAGDINWNFKFKGLVDMLVIGKLSVIREGFIGGGEVVE